MADSARRCATYEDLRAVPGHLVAELLNGELITNPRPSPHHARAASIRLDGAGYRIVGAWRAEAVVRCEPFEALPIRLADLWSA